MKNLLLFLFLFILFPFDSQAQIKYDFETNNLSKWLNSSDWIVTNWPANSKVLKHNLKSIAGTSYISIPLINMQITTQETEWKFKLTNGNFSPTSANKFWFYLFSDSQKLDSICNAYCVGVNFAGTKALLSLWKNKAGKASLILESTFTWTKNQSIAIHIKRSAFGEWNLSYANQSDIYTNVGTKLDAEITEAKYCGLYFKYSKTNAGELALDDLEIGETNQAPYLKEINFVNEKQISLTFNEILDSISAQKIENYSIFKDQINIPISKLKIDKLNHKIVDLFTIPFQYGVFSISCQSIKDSVGLAMKLQTMIKSRNYEAKEKDVVINEIMLDPSPTIELPDAEYIELYNRSKFEIDLMNWKLRINKSDFILPAYKLLANSYLLLSSKGSELLFKDQNNCLGLLSTAALLNGGTNISLFNANQLKIDSLIYDPIWIKENSKKDGGWSLEKIDPNRFCNPNLNWNASIHSTGGTPGFTNSIYKENMDKSEPLIKSVTVLKSKLIQIETNEEFEQKSIQSNNFLLDNNTIDSISIDKISILVYLKDELKEHTNIKLSRLIDLCGNVLRDTSIVLDFYEPKIGDLVINEIMNDPAPSIGLPNQRYIELYNHSSHVLNVKNMKLVYGSSIDLLPNFDMQSHSYLILCADSSSMELSKYGRTLNLKSFPALAISSGSISLQDQYNQSISWVNYQSDWHFDDFKQNGGWSLERIDPSNIGEASENWTSSADKRGGTPSQINSVYKKNEDLKSPEILKIIPITNDSLILYFSESVDLRNGTIGIENNQIISTNIKPIDKSYQKYSVKLNQKLLDGKIYHFDSPKVFYDFANHPTNNFEKINFALPSQVSKDELLFNEILFNAKTGGTEYIELYNNSNKTFNLKKLYITVVDDENKLRNPVLISAEDNLFLPETYFVLSNDPQKIPLYYPNVDLKRCIKTQIPSLSNENGHLALIDNFGNWIDDLKYDRKMHSPYITNESGVSLERVETSKPTNSFNNWMSASSIDSYGTPGYRNSQAFDRSIDLTSEFSISPKVFSPDRPGIMQELSINLNLKRGGYSATIVVYNAFGVMIKYLAKQEIIGPNTQWVWHGEDSSNNVQRPGYYIIFAEIVNLDGEVLKYLALSVLARDFK